MVKTQKWKIPIFLNLSLGATSINIIGEVWLSAEIGGVGSEIWKDPNFIINFRYKIPTVLSVPSKFE